MANLENIALLKDTIRAHEKSFNMNHWSQETSCGTVRCIGGWAEFLDPSIPARDFIGLPPELSGPLFYPPTKMTYDDITVEQALGALDVAIQSNATPGSIEDYWRLVEEEEGYR